MKKNKINYVNKFYNENGWNLKNQKTLDAQLFEDLRKVATKYVSKCRLTLLRHIPKKGENIAKTMSKWGPR